MSGLMASRFLAVSMRVSPLVVDDEAAVKLTPSADSRLAAISNEVRVRVDGSRKRLMTVLPRRVGTFLIGRSEISRKRSPRSRMVRDLLGGQVLHAEEVLVRKRWAGS